MTLRRRNKQSSAVWRAIIAFLLLAMGVSVSAVSYAAYATYFRTHGDWAVVCGLDEPTGRRWCDLKAPPPAMTGNRSEVAVQIGGQGEYVVAVHVRHPISPGAPVYLRIDGGPTYQAQPSRTGEATWSGAEAAAIVAELGKGRRLAMRSFVDTPARPVDEWYSLTLFNQALLDFKTKTGS